MRANLGILAAALLGTALPAWSHDYTLNECFEGADFIKHAAMSRDYGLSREEFLRRLRGDIQAIQAFPPQLRWFVQDTEDEALLTRHAAAVFDAPRAPEVHHAEFLHGCVEHLSARLDPQSTPGAGKLTPLGGAASLQPPEQLE